MTVYPNKINKKQRNKSKSTDNNSNVYKTLGYRAITVVHLDKRVPLDISTKYNTHIREYTLSGGSIDIPLSTLINMSYSTRASDLLIITLSRGDFDTDHISILKKFLPSSLIVYEKRECKLYAKTISKMFGDIKVVKKELLNNVLTKHTYGENTSTNNNSNSKNSKAGNKTSKRINKHASLLNKRPHMLIESITNINGKSVIDGFMKSGLVSDKLIINGEIECLIEGVEIIALDESGNKIVRERISGSELVITEDESEYVIPTYEVEEEEVDNESEESANNDENYETEEVPYVDLIEKYKDYRGIRDLNKCTFKDDPTSPLRFIKRWSILENKIAKRDRRIGENEYVRIYLHTDITQHANNGTIDNTGSTTFFTAFSLFEYECTPTINNFSFSGFSISTGDILTLDNGYRIYKNRAVVTGNYAQKAFNIQRGGEHGVVSLIGPMSMYGRGAVVIDIEKCNSTNSVVEPEEVNINNAPNAALFRYLTDYSSYNRVFLSHSILRGYPMKIFKHHIVIKGMFCTPEQVNYFRNIKLETKTGNSGYIKKSLGTKGLYKAVFDKPVKHGEEVMMKLYKRENIH